MMDMLRSRHMIIASIILGAAIIIIATVAQFAENSIRSGDIPVSRQQWYDVSNGTLSGSRFGYSALFNAAKTRFGATSRQLPTYPDDGKITPTSGRGYVLCINSPERKWNDRESESLLSFVKRGGTVIIVVPTDNHLANTEKFFKKLGIPFTSQSLENEPLITPFLSPYDEIHLSISTDYPVPKKTFIRKGSSAKNTVFLSSDIDPVYKDSQGITVISSLSSHEWNDGRIFWICGALPGYNGESGDPKFKESYFRTYASKLKLDPKKWDAIKKRIEETLAVEQGLEASKIPDQGNVKKIKSGISLFEGLIRGSTEEKRSVVFFDYFRESSDSTKFLALLSSGALYAVILVAFLVFAGLLFFVRGKPPVDALREMKSSQRPDPYPPDEIDPPVLRQGKARFAAQLIHIESELKKLPKEK